MLILADGGVFLVEDLEDQDWASHLIVWQLVNGGAVVTCGEEDSDSEAEPHSMINGETCGR